MTVEVNGRSLTIESAIRVAELGEQVRASASSLARMVKFRALLEKKLSGGEVVYGVNTGFGSLADKAVQSADLKELQLNLIRSHSVRVGSPMPHEVVRAAMPFRVNSLLRGNSAARKEVAELIIAMLNKGVTPSQGAEVEELAKAILRGEMSQSLGAANVSFPSLKTARTLWPPSLYGRKR